MFNLRTEAESYVSAIEKMSDYMPESQSLKANAIYFKEILRDYEHYEPFFNRVAEKLGLNSFAEITLAMSTIVVDNMPEYYSMCADDKIIGQVGFTDLSIDRACDLYVDFTNRHFKRSFGIDGPMTKELARATIGSVVKTQRDALVN